jgi:hypothetical protein
MTSNEMLKEIARRPDMAAFNVAKLGQTPRWVLVPKEEAWKLSPKKT